MTTLHGFGGVLGRPLDTFFWGLAISWSRLFARVRQSGPKFKWWDIWLIKKGVHFQCRGIEVGKIDT